MNQELTSRQNRLLRDLDQFIEYCQKGGKVVAITLPARKFRVFKTIAKKTKKFDLPIQITDESYRGFDVHGVDREVSVRITSEPYQQLSIE
jgi:hypothetical protein